MKKQQNSGKSALILRFLKGSKRFFAVSILMTAVAALADMITPQIIRAAIDNAIGGAEPDFPAPVMRLVEAVGGFAYIAKHMWILGLAVLAVAAVNVLAKYLFRVYNTKGSETLVKTMRDTLYGHIERLPFSWHMLHQTGDIIQRCTSDIDTTRNFVSEQLTNILRIVVLIVFSMLFMFTMNVKLALVALIPIPFILMYSVHFEKKLEKGFLDCDEEEGRLSALVQENLTGVRVVRAFGRERYEKDRFQKMNTHYTGLWVRMAELMSRFWSISDILSGLQVMLIVVCGAAFCVNGSMTSGEYVAFISYNAMLTWPIKQLGRMIAEMSKAGVSVGRIQDIMDAEEEKDDPNGLTPVMDGDICFEHVTFGYDGAHEVLRDVSFTVKAGSTVGILGGTGSGKSTLMYLLDKLYDLPEGCGRITVGGVDIREIRTSWLRQNIGMVSQEPFLFSRTLGDNITITRPGLAEEALRDAARSACLDDTVQGFSKKYETFVGERGVTLSGGQKQRAAIARTLVQKAPIMIFDDSLSAVDTDTDARIRQALEKRFGSATIFLIAHRITTLSKADQVIVLDHGRIAEMGTPEALRKAGGIYGRIAEIQSYAGEEARS